MNIYFTKLLLGIAITAILIALFFIIMAIYHMPILILIFGCICVWGEIGYRCLSKYMKDDM